MQRPGCSRSHDGSSLSVQQQVDDNHQPQPDTNPHRGGYQPVAQPLVRNPANLYGHSFAYG